MTFGWLSKAGIGIDHAEELDDAADPVERTERLMHHRQQVDAGDAGVP